MFMALIMFTLLLLMLCVVSYVILHVSVFLLLIYVYVIKCHVNVRVIFILAYVFYYENARVVMLIFALFVIC